LSGENKDNFLIRFIRWIDDRFGFTNTILRPQPRYSLNPLYWLGALAFIAFMIQGVTGVLLLQYYRPDIENAYETTIYVINMIPYGRLLQSLHLYTAYAMVLLAFIHFTRVYIFANYQRPRELMWMVGFLMGLVTLGCAFTGYLLPWTVISKSAVDVGLGLILNLPEPIGSIIKTIVSGMGSDQELLTRFFSFHIVLLPAVLVILFAIKLHMFEVHGISEPISKRFKRDMLDYEDEAMEPVKWFPDIFVYLLILASTFFSVMLIISSLFPLELPPKYTPEAASEIHPQPEWYFLWMYQILKIEIFERSGVRIALFLFIVLTLIILFWPFIDRSKKTDLTERPIQTTLAVISVVEIIILTYWALITPGKTIPVWEALIVLGSPAALIIGIMYLVYRHINKVKKGEVSLLYEKFIKSSAVSAFPPTLTSLFLIGFSVVAVRNIVDMFITYSIDILALPLFISVVMISIGLLLKTHNTYEVNNREA